MACFCRRPRSPRETWPGGTSHEWQALRVFGTEGRGFESFSARHLCARRTRTSNPRVAGSNPAEGTIPPDTNCWLLGTPRRHSGPLSGPLRSRGAQDDRQWRVTDRRRTRVLVASPPGLGARRTACRARMAPASAMRARGATYRSERPPGGQARRSPSGSSRAAARSRDRRVDLRVDPSLVDWWHLATVVVLSVALFGEAVGAYCAQKGRLARQRSVPLGQRRHFWARLWLKDYGPGHGWRVRERVLAPEVAPVARGVSRLLVALMFLVRFAAGQPPPWSM